MKMPWNLSLLTPYSAETLILPLNPQNRAKKGPSRDSEQIPHKNRHGDRRQRCLRQFSHDKTDTIAVLIQTEEALNLDSIDIVLVFFPY